MADRTVTVKISAQDSFSEVLNKYNAGLGTAQQSTEKVSQASNQMGQAISGAIAAIGIQQVISFAENMQELGDQVNVSRAQFTRLTEDMGGSTRVLDQLRQSTNGVTDDMTLMNASSQLLTSGLVSTSGELSKMLGYLQDLKPAGQSLDEAIGTLSQTLQTGSTRGLNQFGVNVEFVKNRIEELTDAGMNAQDAIKQATFEGMADSLERLGDAASADETPLKKLQTQLENIGQAAAGNFATGVEASIGLLGALGQKADYNARLTEAMNKVYPDNHYNADDVKNFQVSFDRFNQFQPQLQADITHGWEKASDALRAYHQQFVVTEQEQQMAIFKSRFADLSGQFGNITGIEGRYTGLGMQATMPQYLDSHQYAEIQAITDRIIDNAKAIKDQFGDLIPDSQKAALDAMAKSAKDLSDQAQKAADAFKDMKLPDWLGQTDGGFSGQVADQVMAAAQKSGMNDKDLQALQDTLDLSNGRQTSTSQSFDKFAQGLVGLPPDVVAKAISNWVASQQAAALAGLSGSQLAGSESFFAGMVGGGASQKITIKPGQGLNEVMRQYGLTQQQLQSAGAMMGNGKGVLQGNFTVPGMGALDPNFNPQNAIDQFKSMLSQQGGGFGQGGMDFASQTMQSRDDFSSMLDSSQGMKSQFDQIGEMLGKIANMSFNWKITADAPDWLKALFASGGFDFGAQMAKATQNNGGRPPGATSAKPRGGPIVER